MPNKKFGDLIKSAAEVNLRFSADMLNLSKDYVKAFSQAVTSNVGSVDEDDNVPETRTESETEPKNDPRAAQSLLIVAGRKGESANAAFAVNNTSQMSGTVTLGIKGEFSNSVVTVEPDTLTLKNGEGCIIRILAKIGNKMPVDEDFRGTVIINELGMQLSEFIVRRLPDLPATKKPRQRVTKKRQA